MRALKDHQELFDPYDSHFLEWLAQLPANHSRFADQREAAAWFEFWIATEELQQATTANEGLLLQVKQLHDEQSAVREHLFNQSDKAEERQARRYQMCVDAGLKLPDSDYGRLPRGIGGLARKDGVTRQAFAVDVKKHINKIGLSRQ